MAGLFKSRSLATPFDSELQEERRQLTVLFYDIVGSTGMLQTLDPEDIRRELLKVHDMAAECIAAENGSLEHVLGDGGLAYFGYPRASEDAAFQAVRAGDMILRRRAALAQNGETVPDIRIGIATSIVIVPAVTAQQGRGLLGAVGVAPNLADRLQSAAAPNSVLVGRTTRDLTIQAFEFERHDGLTLKGFPDIRSAYQLVGRRVVASRFEMARDTSTPLVARTNEVRALRNAWARAVSGLGSAFLISGEAGVGKSRLTRAVADALEPGQRMILLQCQPSTEGIALFSLIRMYETAFEDRSHDPALADAAMTTAELVQRLDEDETLSPSARRHQIVDGCADVIRGLSRLSPCLIVAEDLHWADEVTLAVLEALAEQAETLDLLIIGTTRSDTVSDLHRLAYSEIDLMPLSGEDAAALVRQKVAGDLSETTVRWIVEKCDGNPLYAIELCDFARDAISEGATEEDVRGSAHVHRLNDLLTARLDMAGRARRTALIASTIGRDVPYDLLAGLAEGRIARTELDADLDRLVETGIKDIEDSGNTYSFRHALVRDAAYDSQPKSVRRLLHDRIVQLAQQVDRLADLIPDEVLAEHCILAGRIAEGAELLIDASETSLRRSALRVPRKMLSRALDLARGLDDTERSRHLKLRAITLLGPVVTQLDGHRSAAPIYEEGQAICRDLDPGQRGKWFPILWGWWFTASDLVEQSSRAATIVRDISTTEDSEARLQALHCNWATLFDGGHHDCSLQAVDEGLSLYDSRQAELSRYRYGHDARVCGLGERALSLWIQGDTEGSNRAMQASLDWAADTGHNGSLLHALDIATTTAFFRRDFAEIEHLLRRVGEASAAKDLPVVNTKREIFASWAAARAGRLDQGAHVSAGLNRLRELGVLEDTAIYADIAADAAVLAGAQAEAISGLDAEIAEARVSGLLFWLPELLRRRAVLAFRAGDFSVARRALDEGLELAVSQNANMLVLRNIAARLDMDMAPDARIRDLFGARLSFVNGAPELQAVVDALGL